MSEENISNSPQWVENIIEAQEHFDAARRLMSGGNWHLERMSKTLKYLIERFSPYKVGDELELSEAPEITNEVRWGLLGSKHFLVEGARCVVREVDCDERGFRYGVVFPEQTYLYQGQPHKPDKPSRFFFEEKLLRPYGG